MQALILAGGKGTRLRPLTVYTPKPIVPVANRPFLLYQIENLARAGIKDITLSLSYQPDKIEDLLGDGSDFSVNLNFITEPSPLGTGGAYKFAGENIRETTVVFNGDVLTDVDISQIIDLHRKNGAEATIALVKVPDPTSYGLVETGQKGEVQRFIEKPTAEMLKEIRVDTINAGIYVLEPSILDLIPGNENTSFEYDVFPAILEQKRKFFAYILDGSYWRDIGTPASYLAAHHDLLAKKVKGFNPLSNGTADIATAASVDKLSLIGDGCVIKPNVRIINSVLGPGVHIDEKAVIENSVIWAHTRVSTLAEIRDSIVGKSCYLGRNVKVTPGSVLGDKSSLTDYSTV